MKTWQSFLLEALIVLFFLGALIFALPYLASDEVSAKNPSIAILTSIVFFTISRGLTFYRDLKTRSRFTLVVSTLLEIFGFLVFLILSQEIMRLNVI
ncbi:MAG: hypothetical protein ABJN69_17465 [Hellea sp.]